MTGFATCLTGTAAGAAGVPAAFGVAAPPKEVGRGERSDVGCAAGGRDGDDFAHAFPIPALPFKDSGATCGFADDLEAPCTFLGGAPDVVYAFTPSSDVVVDIDLCEVGFDAALHVYRGNDLVACNDDACGRGPRIAGLEFAAGSTYHLVIDGWFGACGGYELSVLTDPFPCPLDLPPSAIPEGEPPCADDVFDHFNSGCNDFPYSFRRLDCSRSEIVVDGHYGTYVYYDDEHRDTDWYEVLVREPGVLAARVLGAAPTQLAILDGRLGCGEYEIACGSVLGGACEPIACEAAVEPGPYWVFVAPVWFSGLRCPTPYRLSIRGARCGTIAVSTQTWSAMRSLYR